MIRAALLPGHQVCAEVVFVDERSAADPDDWKVPVPDLAGERALRNRHVIEHPRQLAQSREIA